MTNVNLTNSLDGRMSGFGETSSAAGGVYTDIQGLSRLKASGNSPGVIRELARQFESILLQQVLKSMHAATQSLAPENESETMGLYADLFSRQMSLVMADPNRGIGREIQRWLMQYLPSDAQKPALAANTAPISEKLYQIEVSPEIPGNIPSLNVPQFKSQTEFMETLWSDAKVAADELGCSPDVLLAQAALETGWGSRILSAEGGVSSHNLFNIKAGNGWTSAKATAVTLEESDGILSRKNAVFRVYQSFKESFKDYVNMLKNSSRYQEALSAASSPEKFIHAIQAAGFASDSHYAAKVIEIFKSPAFVKMIDAIKGTG